MNDLTVLCDRVFFPIDNPTFGNPQFENASFRVLIVRLSPFRDVDRSLPHLFLFHHVRRSLPDAFVDMAFFPSAAQRRRFDTSSTPYLIGIQSHRPATDFDLLLISNAYTLELINLPYLLLHSDLPLFADERGPQHPILILGGSNAIAAQCIVRQDDLVSLVDAIFFGEGEEWVGRLVSELAHAGREERRELLPALAARVEGLWATGSTAQVRQAIVHTPQARHLPAEYPLLNGPEAHAASLQISFGCPAFCSFCFEGYDRKPYRELPLEELVAAARQIKAAQGSATLNVYSFNFNVHRDVFYLLHEMNRLFARVSVKSQRVDALYHTPLLLEAQIEADKRTFTLGIEGISERQRAWLHKSLPTADILGLLEKLFTFKIREIKLFYLLTGHEKEQEIAEFRRFVKEIKAMRRSRNRGIRVIFSFGPLVRMPRTPLQYDRLFLDPRHWRPLIGQVKSACETNGFEFRLAFDLPTYFTTQVLALGGHWLTLPVIELAREGHCFDTTLSPAYWTKLRHRLIAARHLDASFLGEKGPNYQFPFPFVRTGVSADFLYRQYRLAREERDDGYCLGAKCLGCGACADDRQRQELTRHTIHVPDHNRYLSRLRRAVVGKRRLPVLYALTRLPPLVAGTHPSFLNAYAMRALLQLRPELIDNLLTVRESLFTVRPLSERFPPPGGETVLGLKGWDTAALRQVLEELTASQTPHMQVLGLLDEFTPGTFTQARLHLHLPAEAFAEPRYHLEQHLRASYLPYSLRRRGERYHIEVPPRGHKKKLLFGGWFTVDRHGLKAELEIGPRFNLLSFLRRFDLPVPELKATIVMSHLR